MKNSIPGFIVDSSYQWDQPVNSLFGEVRPLDASGQRVNWSLRGRNLKEIWLKQPPCERATFARIGISDVYFAQCVPGSQFGLLYHGTPAELSPKKLHTSFPVLATCWKTQIAAGVHRGKNLTNCTRVLANGNLLISYHFQAYEAGLIDAFDNLMRRKISEWRSDCPLTK
jgi:hypothetical protein